MPTSNSLPPSTIISTSVTSAISGAKSQKSVKNITALTEKEQILANTLDINPKYLRCNPLLGDDKNEIISHTYLSFLEINRATADISSTAWNQVSEWGSTPTKANVTELIIAPSTYHTWSNLFKPLPKYPLMKKWLQNGADRPDTASVWGDMPHTKLTHLTAWFNEQEKTEKTEKKRKNKSEGSSKPR